MSTRLLDHALESPQLGIVLFAHGSRDPLWKLPIEAVARTITSRHAGVPVSCAYLELCSPDLNQAVLDIMATGARRIRVFPLFLGVGRHAREDLPLLIAEMKTRYPDATIELMPTAGEHPALVSLMADLALG